MRLILGNQTHTFSRLWKISANTQVAHKPIFYLQGSRRNFESQQNTTLYVCHQKFQWHKAHIFLFYWNSSLCLCLPKKQSIHPSIHPSITQKFWPRWDILQKFHLVTDNCVYSELHNIKQWFKTILSTMTHLKESIPMCENSLYILPYWQNLEIFF